MRISNPQLFDIIKYKIACIRVILIGQLVSSETKNIGTKVTHWGIEMKEKRLTL